ncbi:expressed protein [Phakopsora pachyrhizi]|uniref:Expressed protein n=1 Tax=Phakopsora pachyrhizi TaxID=170000 RepID=A0AAV0B1T2_PHAPC|nr:expressed protein [Phakopsora pachyrhizi]
MLYLSSIQSLCIYFSFLFLHWKTSCTVILNRLLYIYVFNHLIKIKSYNHSITFTFVFGSLRKLNKSFFFLRKI